MKGKMNAKTIACLVLTVMYFAGLVLMLCGNLQSGGLLWGISTVAGMGVLYYINKREKAAREAEEQEKGDRE